MQAMASHRATWGLAPGHSELSGRNPGNESGAVTSRHCWSVGPGFRPSQLLNLGYVGQLEQHLALMGSGQTQTFAPHHKLPRLEHE